MNESLKDVGPQITLVDALGDLEQRQVSRIDQIVAEIQSRLADFDKAGASFGPLFTGGRGNQEGVLEKVIKTLVEAEGVSSSIEEKFHNSRHLNSLMTGIKKQCEILKVELEKNKVTLSKTNSDAYVEKVETVKKEKESIIKNLQTVITSFGEIKLKIIKPQKTA